MAFGRTIVELEEQVRDSLGVLHDESRLQQATFWRNMLWSLREIHSMVIQAHGPHYRKLGSEQSAAKNEVRSSAFTTLETDFFLLRAIHYYDSTVTPPSITYEIKQYEEGGNKTYKLIDDKIEWFPRTHSAFSYKLEYERDFTVPTKNSNTPDIPAYCDPFLAARLIQRLSPLVGVDPRIHSGEASARRRELNRITADLAYKKSRVTPQVV